MKFLFYLSVPLITLFTTAGCTTDKQSDSSNKCEEIFVDPTTSQTIKRSELFTLERIIKLQDNPNIGEVNDLLMNKDYIIYESDNIRLFNYEGEFLGNIGARGNGPGEYQTKDLDLDKDSLMLMDVQQQKLLKYQLSDGELVSEKSLGKLGVFGRSYAHEQNLNMFYVGNQLNQYGNKKLLLFDEEMEFVDSYFTVKKKEIPYLNFIDKTNFSVYEDSVRFLYAYSDGIYNISAENGRPSVSRRYCVNFGDYGIPDGFFQRSFRNVREFAIALRESNYASQVMGFFETDHNIMFMFKYGSERLMGIYSKEDKQTTIIKNIYDDLLFKGMTISPEDEFFSSYFFHDSRIYFVVYAFQLIDNIKKVRELNPDAELNSQLRDIYKKIDKDDNPLIIEFKINKT